jgi:ketosteroid isomerase-like protein
MHRYPFAPQLEKFPFTFCSDSGSISATYGIVEMVSDLKSDISELNVISSSDMAIVTCTMKQSYTYEGKSISIVAPTTVAFRRESGGWKVVLIQSVPFA